MADKNWTIEQALEAQEEAAATDPDIRWSLRSPFMQWYGLHELDGQKELFERGHGIALFHAIRICAELRLTMPEWVARAFFEGYDKVVGLEVASWDKAFGRPYRKGVHLEEAKKRRILRLAVYNRICSIILSWRPGWPPAKDWPTDLTAIDDALFERVADEFKIGKTLCAELYYEAKEAFELLVPLKP